MIQAADNSPPHAWFCMAVMLPWVSQGEVGIIANGCKCLNGWWLGNWKDIHEYCWWTKSCTTKDDEYPIIYRGLYIPGGCLGFRPSTVCFLMETFQPKPTGCCKKSISWSIRKFQSTQFKKSLPSQTAASVQKFLQGKKHKNNGTGEIRSHLGVSKNRGKTPKMDGENHGKPYEKMGWFGGISPTIFGFPSISKKEIAFNDLFVQVPLL